MVWKKVLRKKNQPLYRPGESLNVSGGWCSQISRNSAHESRKFVSSTYRPPSPPRKYSWYLFNLRHWVDPKAIVRPEGLRQWRIPITPSGNKSSTFCTIRNWWPTRWNFLYIYLYPISSTCFGRYFCPSSGAHDYIRSCKYSQVLLMMGENIARNM